MPQISFSRGSGGLLHFSRPGNEGLDFAIDGKEYKAANGDTHTWTSAGANKWTAVIRRDGKEFARDQLTLSPDGKTLTSIMSGVPEAQPGTSVWARVDGAEGLIGTWRLQLPDIIVAISSPAPDLMRVESVGMKAWVEGRIDGSDLPVHGEGVPAGMTQSYTQVSPTQRTIVQKINGKEMQRTEETLAADGRSFSDVITISGKKDSATFVFMKQ
jgi:hypothetical protein